MRVTDTLSKELIIPHLKGENKVDVLTELAEAIAQSAPELDKDEISHVLLEREKLGSTGIQDGIAIPHGKIDALSKVLIAFGRNEEGIDFQAHDNQKTHLFFVLLAPEDASGYHLTILARLSRLLKEMEVRKKLLKAKNAEEIYQILCKEEAKLQESGVLQS